MSKIPDDAINAFDPHAWVTRTERQKGYVTVDGALLAHPEPSKIYFATLASGDAVRFELNKDDIAEVMPSDVPTRLSGHQYKGVRILLSLDALVARVSLHLASNLVEYPQGALTALDGTQVPMRNMVVGAALMR